MKLNVRQQQLKQLNAAFIAASAASLQRLSDSELLRHQREETFSCCRRSNGGLVHHSRVCTSGQTAAQMSRLVVSWVGRGVGTTV